MRNRWKCDSCDIFMQGIETNCVRCNKLNPLDRLMTQSFNRLFKEQEQSK